MRFLSSRRFLAIYSGVLTLTFAVTVLTAFKASPQNATFDQLTVQRLNVVEPDGTTRMVLSNKAQFPGLYYHGKDHARTDRDSAGMIFNNDEGTENGGLIFGGYKDAKGVAHGYGHLSFDRYDQDQVVNIEQNEDGDQRTSGIAINDVGEYALTPQFMDEVERVKSMPHGAARAEAWKSFKAKYPGDANRAYLGRASDKSVGLSLRDTKGRERLRMVVKPDGAPVIEFLDEAGKVVNEYSAVTRTGR
ncbi:MAG TPA: hypothetical protein VK627_01005 [Edaphobacter sp.]|jgi:hypothetical protein|nr:hypothetical protein [Edaphobacter sp.]